MQIFRRKKFWELLSFSDKEINYSTLRAPRQSNGNVWTGGHNRFKEQESSQEQLIVLKNVTKLVQPILYFQMSHNTLCLPPKMLHKLLFSNALGNM